MLDDALEKYQKSNAYPFHMPGHKRQNMGMEDPYAIDITEIDGFDNLHDPQGLILETMKHLQKLYHSRRSFLLVNGSTCGNLAAVFTATGFDQELIIARNCHKSVYHGAYLRRSRLHYLYPRMGKEQIPGEIFPEDVEKLLQQYPASRAVVITSPTYEGIVSDVAGIAEVCHRRGVPLIVDAAHGAHLGFHPYFPESPVKEGADAVIMSLHKTLPSFTQTAVLHLNGELLSEEKCREYLSVFQSSSPSYILMSGITKCVRFLESEGEEAFETYAARLQEFYWKTEQLKWISVLHPEHQDPSKILISSGRSGLTGEELSGKLRTTYGLEMEMSSFDYTLAMTSVMDRQEGFDRLAEALMEIDREAGKKQSGILTVSRRHDADDSSDTPAENSWENPSGSSSEKVMELWQAQDAERECVPMDQAQGRTAAKSVAIYPPGIPLLVPGEKITEEQVEMIRKAQQEGLYVEGLQQEGAELSLIQVVASREETKE